MIKNILLSGLGAVLLLVGAFRCKKETYSFGDIKTPSNLTLATEIVGVDAANPDGDGSGNVVIAAAADNAVTYKIDFGNGVVKMVPSGTLTYRFTSPGTNTYTITVNAVGTGGALSTVSKQVTVFVAFEIPAQIVADLTDGTSKIWVCDHDAPGHFGVGPADQFSPIWYAAAPNSREACAYDDEITFSKDGSGKIFMGVDNKGESFSIGAASAYYGFGGGDNCYGVDATGNKQLAFMDATSGAGSAVSTGVQFMVPGNGIINFGTGGNTYEILSISATSMHLRNIGIDGNAWYQILKPKP